MRLGHTILAGLLLAVACDAGVGALETDETGDSLPMRGPSSDGDEDIGPVDPPRRPGSVDETGPTEEPPPQCEDHSACFSSCGTRSYAGDCVAASEGALVAEDFGVVLCKPVDVELVDGVATLAASTTERDARCFLQVLRYGHEGVAELNWAEAATGRSGHVVVKGLGGQYARLEMRLDGVEAECGDAITLSAPKAHVWWEREPLFDACLDEPDNLDPATCLLGPAATFFEDHDFVFGVAFPWLSGACGV